MKSNQVQEAFESIGRQLILLGQDLEFAPSEEDLQALGNMKSQYVTARLAGQSGKFLDYIGEKTMKLLKQLDDLIEQPFFLVAFNFEEDTVATASAKLKEKAEEFQKKQGKAVNTSEIALIGIRKQMVQGEEIADDPFYANLSAAFSELEEMDDPDYSLARTVAVPAMILKRIVLMATPETRELLIQVGSSLVPAATESALSLVPDQIFDVIVSDYGFGAPDEN